MILAQLLAENANNLELREFQIATMMVRGYTNQEIADQLGIAFKTVKNVVSKIWPKLGVHDTGHARGLRNQARSETQP